MLYLCGVNEYLAEAKDGDGLYICLLYRALHRQKFTSRWFRTGTEGLRPLTEGCHGGLSAAGARLPNNSVFGCVLRTIVYEQK